MSEAVKSGFMVDPSSKKIDYMPKENVANHSQGKWFLYIPFFLIYFCFAAYFYFSVIEPYLASKDFYGPRLLADAITYESICVIERDFLDYASLRDIGPCLGLWIFSYNSGLLSLVDGGLIVGSVVWMARAYNRSWQPMLALALINPITFYSMFGANKEVFGFSSFALLAIFIKSRSLWALIFCLVTALFTRIPALVTTLSYCILLVAALPRSGVVSFQQKQQYWFMIASLIVVVSLIAAVYGQSLQNDLLGDFSRAEDVSRSTELSLSLNPISNVGAYILVYVVRVCLNFYGGVVGFINLWNGEGVNYYTVAVSGSSAIFILLSFLILRRGIPNDIVGTAVFWNIALFVIFNTLLLCLSPVVQHRYFFPVYAIMILFTVRSEKKVL